MMFVAWCFVCRCLLFVVSLVVVLRCLLSVVLDACCLLVVV